MTIQPGTDIGRYHILEKLGEGGMAVVYKAYDTRTETDVAIKFIRTENILPKALDKALKRFQIEAKKMAQLNHPNIVPVTDFGEYEGSPFLVMRYLPGGTLKGLMGEPLPFPQAVKLMIPIANALKYAHEQGVIHRDIKPGNILITQSGQPVLSDFGVAKVLESEETLDLTTTGMGVGTPEYMAPEQAEGKPVNEQADVYSLGIVFYELVTGRKPFTAETPMAVIVKQMHDPLPQPTLYNPLLPREVEQVLFKALAKKPENRYADMGELIQALEGLAGIKEKAVSAKTIARFKAGEKSAGQHAATPLENYRPSTGMPGQQVKSKSILIIIASFGILGMLAVLVFTNQNRKQPAAESPQPIQSPQTLETPLTQPTEPQADNEAIPILGIGSTAVSKKDGMTLVYVPAGEFEMGSQDGEADEQPVHKVFLDAFWIDRTEVTNAQYSKCVEEGACTPPMASGSQTQKYYFGRSTYADFPVVYVNWNQAVLYCRWAGRELPTEAQWEKAARGTDGRAYPWGDATPNSAFLNFNANDGDTTKVGSYLQGASLYGAMDMAGNVWEWTADWYDSEYYFSQDSWRNPLGPSAGEYHVQRGGSWGDIDVEVRSTYRKKKYPTYGNNYEGFRCAQDAGSVENLIDINSLEVDMEENESQILISEDFEGEKHEGYIPAGWYQWQIMKEMEKEGNTVLSINMVDSDLYPETFLIGNSVWKDTIIKLRLKIEKCSNTGGAALIDLGGRYYLNLSCLHNQIYFNEWDAPNILEVNIDVKEGKWYEFEIDNSRSQFSLKVNGIQVVNLAEFPRYPGLFRFSADPDSWIFYDDVMIIQGNLE